MTPIFIAIVGLDVGVLLIFVKGAAVGKVGDGEGDVSPSGVEVGADVGLLRLLKPSLGVLLIFVKGADVGEVGDGEGEVSPSGIVVGADVGLLGPKPTSLVLVAFEFGPLLVNFNEHGVIPDTSQAASFSQSNASGEATRAYTPGYPVSAQPLPLPRKKRRRETYMCIEKASSKLVDL